MELIIKSSNLKKLHWEFGEIGHVLHGKSYVYVEIIFFKSKFGEFHQYKKPTSINLSGYNHMPTMFWIIIYIKIEIIHNYFPPWGCVVFGYYKLHYVCE